MTGSIRSLSALFAFAVPVIGVLAPKGMVIALIVTGIGGVVLWIREGRPTLPVARSMGIALAALALWGALAASWGFAPGQGVVLVVGLVAVGIAGTGAMVAAIGLDDDGKRTAENAFLAGMGVALAAMAVAYFYARATEQALWGRFQFDPLTPLNSGAVAISLLAWPALALLYRRGHLWPAVAGAIAVFGGVSFLSSGAALLAPVFGLAAFVGVWLFDRRGAVALAVVVAALVLFAPQAVTTATTALSASGLANDLPPAADHRLKMWAFTAGKIDEKPLWGWGLDASRSIPDGDRLLAPEVEILPLHPHNAFLQVRLELGIPGTVIFAALVGLFFRDVVGHHERVTAAFIAAAGSAYLTVACVSFGVWQNWWWAFAWALAALTALALRPSLAE